MELIRLAVMPLSEAKALQDQLKKLGIDIVLNHDDSSCTRGCTVTVEVQGLKKDIQVIAKIYQENFKKLTTGHEVNWDVIDSVFDPEAQEVTCPACSHKFRPRQGECPDCGLTFY